MRSSYILWFRPEIVETVKWGGNPEKPVREEAGTLRPRAPFKPMTVGELASLPPEAVA